MESTKCTPSDGGQMRSALKLLQEEWTSTHTEAWWPRRPLTQQDLGELRYSAEGLPLRPRVPPPPHLADPDEPSYASREGRGCAKLKETFRTLDDFEYLAERDLDELPLRWDWEAKTGRGPTERAVETSRLRQIHSRLQAQRRAAEKLGTASQEADLDLLLPRKAMQSRMGCFYQRYRLTLTPKRMPSERTVARTARESGVRGACVVHAPA